MKQTKNNFHYNMIKGRVAEAIIKELFQANGYRVYDYGMERTLPHAVENVKNQYLVSWQRANPYLEVN